MQQALYRASIATFEELGFMFPEPREDASAVDNDRSVNVWVGFEGPLSGKLILRVEHGVLPVVAANMLGEETALDDAMLRDVAREIANVICGNALPEVGGKTAVFNLSAPEIFSEMRTATQPQATAQLTFDEGRADVLLYLD